MPAAPIDINVAVQREDLGAAGVIFRKQVDRLNATATDGPEQVVQLRGVLSKEAPHRLM